MKKTIVVLILLILVGGSNVGAMKKMSAFDDCYSTWKLAPIYQVLGFVTLCKGGHWNCLKCGNRKYKDYEKIKDHMVEAHGVTLLERHDGIDEVYGGRVRRNILGKRKIKYYRLDNDLEPKRKRRKRRKKDNKQDNQDMRFISVASVLSKPRSEQFIQNTQEIQTSVLQNNQWGHRRSKYVSKGHMKFFGKKGFECCYCNKIFSDSDNGSNVRRHLDGYNGPKRKMLKSSHNVDVDMHISEQDFTKLQGVTNYEVLRKYGVNQISRHTPSNDLNFQWGSRQPSKYVLNGHMIYFGKHGYKCCYCDMEFEDSRNIRSHLDGYNGPKRKRLESSHSVDVDKHISEQDFTRLQGVTNKKVLKKYRVKVRVRRSKYVSNGHMKFLGVRGYQCCYCLKIFQECDGASIERHLNGYSGPGKKGVKTFHNVDIDAHISEQDFSNLQNVTNRKIFKKYGVYQNVRPFLRYNCVRQKKSRSKYVLNGHMKCVGQEGFECCYCRMQFKDGKRMGRHLDGYNGIGKKVEASHNVDVDKHISEQDFSKLQNVTNKKILKKYGSLN